jgi:hypothetical protein
MIQTTVTPHKKDFDMTVSLPADYVGKEVHVLFYIDEELERTTSTILPQKKPSDFFGILTKEEGKKMDMHIQQMRNEWNRDT